MWSLIACRPQATSAPDVPTLLAAAAAHEEGDRGDSDERLDAELGGADDDSAFRIEELRARHALDPASRTRALAHAERLLASGLARHCDVAQGAAFFVGEQQGKNALLERLADLQRDAQLSGARECEASTRGLTRGLGGTDKQLALGGSAPRIEAVSTLFDEDAARVVIVLQADADPAILSGMRLVDDRLSAGTITSVHLPGIAGAARELPGTGLVSRVVSSPSSDGTDVRFELSRPGSKRVHFLLEPPRIVVDLAPAERVHPVRRVQRVVLDAGHGGFDPGAIGPGDVREKDVALDVVLRAGRALRQQGFDVRLTRDSDRAVPIENRSAFANAADADLFVSVHCNASENPTGHGIETYVLDDARAGRDAEVRVAARENGGSENAVIALSGLLARTRVREHSERSHAFADQLQRTATGTIRGAKDGGVHPAAFSVLVGARMPAVLFETSYVSNPREGALLATPGYRQKLADALVRAIENSR